MKAHIVLAHPEAKSFNAHLSGTSQRVLGAAGWQTSLSDLYAMDFDPLRGAASLQVSQRRGGVSCSNRTAFQCGRMKPRPRM